MVVAANYPEPSAVNHQTPVEVVPSCTHPQPTPRTPFLPSPPAPAKQQIRKTFITRPPTYSNSQFDQKQGISRPYIPVYYEQCSPPLQRPVMKGPHHSPQVPPLLYIPVVKLTLSNHSINLLAQQAYFMYQNQCQAVHKTQRYRWK